MGDNLRTGGAPAPIYTQTQPEIKFDVNSGMPPATVKPAKPKVIESIKVFHTNADRDYGGVRQFVGIDKNGFRRQILVGIDNNGRFYYKDASKIKKFVYKDKTEDKKHILSDAVKHMRLEVWNGASLNAIRTNLPVKKTKMASAGIDGGEAYNERVFHDKTGKRSVIVSEVIGGKHAGETAVTLPNNKIVYLPFNQSSKEQIIKMMATKGSLIYVEPMIAQKRTYSFIRYAHVDQNGTRYRLKVGKTSDGIYYVQDAKNKIILLQQTRLHDEIFAFKTINEMIHNNGRVGADTLKLFEQAIPVKLAKT